MSADGSATDSGPGRREVAHRLFAAEFDDATVSYSESDEERAPKYVVTPTGARVNRLFAVGVLTEVESVNEDVLRARVVDPTGAFVSYAGQYQPDAAAFFERATPPTFVALTGKARTFEPDDGDRIYTSIRPESVADVDADTRDRWTVSAAEATLRRVAAMAEARETGLRGDDLEATLLDAGYDPALAAGIPIALARYETTPAYLDAVRRLALDALEVVAGDRDEVRPLTAAPDEGGAASVGPVPASVRVETADLAAIEAPTTDAGGTEASESAADEDSATAATTAAESSSETADEVTDASATEQSAGETSEQPAGETSEQSDDDAEETARDVGASDAESVVDDDSTVTTTDSPSEPTGTTEPTPETAETTADEAPTDDATADDATADDAEEGDGDADDLGDFESSDEMYELDEEERRAVEEEYDVGFESAADVDDPGEADIDVPDADGVGGESADEGDDADAGTDEGDDADAGIDEGDTDASAGADDADATVEADDAEGGDGDAAVDLESAAVDVMDDLDDGDGVDRERVVAAVVDEHGVDPAAVDDAIQDALMSGRCYEPTEGTLKAI